MTDECGEWKATVTGKGEHLARGGGHVADRTAKSHYNDDACHDGGPCMGFRGIVENLDEWEASLGREDISKVSNAEAEGDDHDESSGAVE